MWKTYFRKDSEKISIEYDKVLVKKQTKIQLLEILQTKTFGRAVFMDNCPESSDIDNPAYHEVLVHPAMILHKKVKKVFIAGGGEGVMLKEILKHPSVEKIVQCDIDEEAIEIFDKYLPGWHEGSYNNRKVKLIFADARGYLASSKEKFDLIIVDITAPIHGGASHPLFTKDFYRIVKNHLNKNGILTVQSQSVNPNNLTCISALYHSMKQVFKNVFPMHAIISIFGDDWGFLFASDSCNPLKATPVQIDGYIKKNKVKLSFYSGSEHLSLFHLPKYFDDYISEHKDMSTDKKPFEYPNL